MFFEEVIDYIYDEIKCLAKKDRKNEIVENFTFEEIKGVFDRLSMFYDMTNENTRPKWSNLIYEIIYC